MNKKILTPLFVAASFLLIGCSTSEIVGRPSWINDPIVVNPTDLKDNTLKEIYDAIKKLGDTNANVLNKVMYQIASKQIGTFDELTKFSKPENKGNDEFKAFVQEHSMYQPDSKSAVKEGETIVVKELADLTDDQKNDISYNKIKQQYDTIVERIFEKMYNEVKGGSYTTDSIRKLFSEEEYVRHLKKEFYAPKTDGITFNGKQVFTPKPIGMTWKEFVNSVNGKDGYLHIMDSNNNLTELYYPKTEGEDGGYIGRKILPETYREVLIEKYVREQRYTNLGRGYARKAQMIKIDHGNYDGHVLDMLTYYAKNHITGDGTNKATYGSLDDLNAAMIGIADTAAGTAADPWGIAREYLEKGHFDKINFDKTEDGPIIWQMHIDDNGERLSEGAKGKITYVYHGTKLGDLVEKYMKAYDLTKKTIPPTDGANFDAIQKSPFTEEAKTALNELTNNGAYTIDVGLEIKEREILSTDLTQDGWYMKEGGLTDLAETFRSRLFNISTSNIIDDKDKMTTSTEAGSIGWGNYESGDYARYFDSTDKGAHPTQHAYIVSSLVESDKAWDSVILSDNNNRYIVQVDEAASLSKLSLDDDRAYIRLKATDVLGASNNAMNEIIREITKQVANSDTYKKNAEQYYLMISNILFYDQSVYDYFKSQFPELFK